jgi:hypothetical protein
MTPTGRVIAWSLGAALASGITANWLIATPEADQLLTPIREDHWRLPEMPRPLNLAALYAGLRQHTPWGEQAGSPPASQNEPAGAAPADSQSAGAPAWRFSGIVSAGEQHYMLLIDPTNQQARRFAPQDLLPDQARLRSVKPNSVEIERDGRIEVLRLYQNADIKP